MLRVTLPPWTSPDPDNTTYPGRIPLRPLAFGEVISVAFGLWRRHLPSLLPLATVFAILSAACTPVIMWLRGDLANTGSLTLPPVEDLLEMAKQGRTDQLLQGPLLALLIGALCSLMWTVAGIVVLAGRAAALIGHDAVTTGQRPELITQRLSGRGLRLLVAGVLVGAMTAVGLFVLIVPGLFVLCRWVLAGPVITMEAARTGAAVERSMRLTRGMFFRVFGFLALGWLISTALTLLLSSLAGVVVVGLRPAGAYLAGFVVSGLAQLVVLPLAGCLIAACYTDIRIRREQLAQALHNQYQADQAD